MNTQSLLDRYFEVAFSAPEGVKRLRELILNLAMRGLLVPQDPTAQPARELLREIEAEKEQLIRAGKLKKTNKLPELLPEEIPYELPKSWEWVRLGNIGESNIGLTYKPSDVGTAGIPVLRSTNIQNGKLNLLDLKRVDLNIKDSLYVKKGDLLICVRNGSKDLVGKTALIENLPEEMTFGAFMAIFRSPINEYLLRFINSSLFKKNISDVSTTTINQITQKNLKYTAFPLPPLEEQKRIVEKVDLLMEQCDRLEQLHKEREQKRIIVHAAARDRLLNTKGDRELQTAWEFLRDRFGDLYAVKENISELRKVILQLAVMGKLVPQDPNDPPASELLKEIQAEKQRLVKEGKIKKANAIVKSPLIKTPFELPETWQWVYLEEITSRVTDGDHKTPPRISKGYRLLSAKNVRDGFVDLNNCDYISEENYIKSRERCLPEHNDLLIVSVGGTIGRSSLVPKDSQFALVRSVALIKPLLINSEFLKYAMDSDFLQASIHDRKRGGAQPCLYLSEIQKFNFPLPPLPEQHRIVAKVDQLMELCDQLESKIDQQTQTQTRLLNTLMAELN